MRQAFSIRTIARGLRRHRLASRAGGAKALRICAVTLGTGLQWCGLAAGVWLATGVGAGLAEAGVAVSPLKQEISLKPGQAGKVAITLTNHSRSQLDATQSVHLSIVDVQVAEDGTISFPAPGVMDSSASKWVSLSRTTATLEPNESQVVECTIRLPPAAPPGEYYTAVMVTMDTKGRTDKGVVVQYRIASGIFVTVLGRTFARQAKISRCEFVWPDISEAVASQPAASQPAEMQLPKVSVLLHNTGRARFEASGKMRILDAGSRVVLSGPLSSKRAWVFGGDSRLFEAPLTKALPAGKYMIKVEMDYESTWSRARYQLPVEILPQHASLLALLNKQYQMGLPPMEVQPEKIALTLPAGAMRSLGLTARNTSDGPLRGAATVAPSEGPAADAWLTVGPQEFTIAQSGRKTVELKVQIPPGTAPGKYASAVALKAGLDGSTLRELKVPVEIDVETGK